MRLRRQRNGQGPHDGAICMRQGEFAYVKIVHGGSSPVHGGLYYLVVVSQAHIPHYTYPVNSIVEAYRIYLLALELMKQGHNEYDKLSIEVGEAFRNSSMARRIVEAIGQAPFLYIQRMRVGQMPESVQKIYMSRTSGRARKG